MFFSKNANADIDYLIERAATEAELAQRASGGKPADLHHQLASAYLARAFDDDPDDSTHPKIGIIQENRDAIRSAISALAHVAPPVPESGEPGLSKLLSCLH